MWCSGRGIQHGIEWVPTPPSCTAHDLWPRLWRIRAAASAPLQPAQLAQDGRPLANDVPLHHSLSSRVMRSRQMSRSAGRISNEPTHTALAPSRVVQTPSQALPVASRDLEAASISLALPGGELAVAADRREGSRPQGLARGSRASKTAATPAATLTGTELQPSLAELASSSALLTNFAQQARYGGSSKSSSCPDTEALIRLIARVNLHRHDNVNFNDNDQQRQQDPDAEADVDPSASCSTGLYGGFPHADASPGDAASLLRALDVLPDIEGGGTCGMVSRPVLALGPDAARMLLGPGIHPIDPGRAQSDKSASPGPNPRPQHLHIPEALRGLFSGIAPASAITDRPQTCRGGGVPPSTARAQPASHPERHPQPVAAPAAVAQHPAAATATAAVKVRADVANIRGIEASLDSDLRPHQQRRSDERLMGVGSDAPGRSDSTDRDPSTAVPSAAAQLYAAAGVALPPWAEPLLPLPTALAAMVPTAAAADLILDPSLEWALGVLSSRMAPREPRHGDIRLANRILAAHLGPQPPAAAVTGVSAATAAAATPEGSTASMVACGGGGRGKVQHSRAMLPWPLLLPVLDVVAGRLSPSSAVALLRVISLQAGPNWRRELPPRHQAHMVATLRVCFRAALRSPDAVSSSAAAGLLELMCRLHVRSEPACALLVGRILTGLVPVWRAMAPPAAAPPSSSPSQPTTSPEPTITQTLESPPLLQPTTPPEPQPTTTTAAQSIQTPLQSHTQAAAAVALQPVASPPADGAGVRGTSEHQVDSLPVSALSSPEKRATRSGQSGERSSSGSNSSSSSSAGVGARGRRGRQHETARRPPRGRGVGGAAAKSAGGRDGMATGGGGGMRVGRGLLGPRWRQAQLRWACVAMSTLVRLRISRFSLPRRALTKLLWAALFAGAHWTPGIAAALPVWAARLDCRPPAAFLRRYSRVLLRTEPTAAAAATAGDKQPSHQLSRRRQQRARRRWTDAAAATAAATRRGRRCLVDRMTAPQLAAALEALVSQYGPCTARPEAVPVAVVDAAFTGGEVYGAVSHMLAGCCSSSDGGSSTCSCTSSKKRGSGSGSGSECSRPSAGRRLALRYTGYRELMHALLRALLSRLQQLRCQQLCRLPLLLRQVGQPEEQVVVVVEEEEEAEVEAVAAGGAPWQQVFVCNARRQLSSCDVVDVMLLLRGLAAGSTNATGAVSPETRAGRLDGDRGGPNTAACATMTYMYDWMGSELADDALRRYAVLLPSATLYHTAAVLESLSFLWAETRPQQQQRSSTNGGSSVLQCSDSSSSSLPLTARTTADVAAADPSSSSSSPSASLAASPSPPPFATPSPTPAPTSNSPEADLRRRRLADLTLERDFLLQQLAEHVAACLSYSSGGPRASRHRRRAGSPPLRADVAPGLLVKVLAAYSRLQRPPAPRLQGALEAALLERADSLGTSGWQAVRAAYQQLRLQPGPEFSVALLTFA